MGLGQGMWLSEWKGSGMLAGFVLAGNGVIWGGGPEADAEAGCVTAGEARGAWLRSVW